MSGISKRNTSGLRDRAAHLFANPVPPSPSEVRLSPSLSVSLYLSLGPSFSFSDFARYALPHATSPTRAASQLTHVARYGHARFANNAKIPQHAEGDTP